MSAQKKRHLKVRCVKFSAEKSLNYASRTIQKLRDLMKILTRSIQCKYKNRKKLRFGENELYSNSERIFTWTDKILLRFTLGYLIYSIGHRLVNFMRPFLRFKGNSVSVKRSSMDHDIGWHKWPLYNNSRRRVLPWRSSGTYLLRNHKIFLEIGNIKHNLISNKVLNIPQVDRCLHWPIWLVRKLAILGNNFSSGWVWLNLPDYKFN